MFTYSLSTPEGQIRRLIPDRDQSNYFFEDSDLVFYYELEGFSVYKGAALALEVLATNEAYVQKVIRLYNLSTDGSKTAETLLKRADRLRSQAHTAELSQEALFDIVPQVDTTFGYEEYVRKLW